MLETYYLDGLINDCLFLEDTGPFGLLEFPMNVKLVAAPFSPSKTLAEDDLVLATFTGGAPKTLPVGPQLPVYDTPSKRWGLMLKEPAGGLNFVCSSAPAEPETIYGFIVNGPYGLYFSGLLPDGPKVISNIGDFVSLSSLMGFLPSDLFPELPPSV